MYEYLEFYQAASNPTYYSLLYSVFVTVQPRAYGLFFFRGHVAI